MSLLRNGTIDLLFPPKNYTKIKHLEQLIRTKTVFDVMKKKEWSKLFNLVLNTDSQYTKTFLQLPPFMVLTEKIEEKDALEYLYLRMEALLRLKGYGLKPLRYPLQNGSLSNFVHMFRLNFRGVSKENFLSDIAEFISERSEDAAMLFYKELNPGDAEIFYDNLD